MAIPSLLSKESKSETKLSLFERCRSIDVSDIIRKNYQGIHYISWADAWGRLKKFFPEAFFLIREFEGLPYLKTEFGVWVEVQVTIEDQSLNEKLPVMDNKMNALLTPNARDINDAIKRCLVKAMALHGFGLECYQSDDIYHEDKKEIKDTRTISEAQWTRLVAIAKSKDISKEWVANIMEAHGFTKWNEITRDAYDKIVLDIQA